MIVVPCAIESRVTGREMALHCDPLSDACVETITQDLLDLKRFVLV